MALGDNNRGVDFGLRGKTPEERSENCRRGAYAAAEAKRRKRTMQESMLRVANMDIRSVNSPKIKKIYEELKASGFEDADVFLQDAMTYVAMKKAITQGDIEAARFCRDTSGQAPTSKVAVGSVQDFDDLDLSRLSKEELLKLAAEADE